MTMNGEQNTGGLNYNQKRWNENRWFHDERPHRINCMKIKDNESENRRNMPYWRRNRYDTRYRGDVTNTIFWGWSGQFYIMQIKIERSPYSMHRELNRSPTLWDNQENRDTPIERLLVNQNKEEWECQTGLQTRIRRSRSLDIASYTPNAIQLYEHINKMWLRY